MQGPRFGRPAVVEVACENLLDLIEIAFDVRDEDRTVLHVIDERLADLALATTADRAGLVTERPFGGRADDAPRRSGGMFLHPDLVARGSHVDLARQQWNADRPVAPLPRDVLLAQIGSRVFGDVDEIGIEQIDSVTFEMHVDPLTVFRDHVIEGPSVVTAAVDLKLLAEAPAWEDQRPAGMFLFDVPHQVRGVTDLRLDLFLAVAEVVVGDDRDDDARFGAAGDFERLAVVVEFVFVFPAHAIALLSLGGLADVRQSHFALRQLREVWREDHAAGVSRPVLDIERRVVDRHERIARVAEDRLDEVEIADQRSRREEADFHCLLQTVAGDFGTDQRAQQDRDPIVGLLLLLRRERQLQQIEWRIHRVTEQFNVSPLGNGSLVSGDRQSTLGDMERADGCASIRPRVVQHSVSDAV